ncbi:hypothetical protein [Beggiatoa leptomitoformis]|uniref:Uncharacterized protein n=1 Tax=Beggiatoa leptomitoformis TaxID=288004 RepID=A0A2N9YE47_9GAMM|nr:hypothetical protein [Beggiatoa leptomitoformis]ALG68908.1 hypothetical protein AL038_15895 [Beggiatoa leptomitoformis]AUI68716.1 hypothetical protein BLE401_08365 [Beggiatoa leptomitoformis]
MAYSIFLGTSQKRTEIHLFELEESMHDYIFVKNKSLIKKESRFYRMSDYYKDAIISCSDMEVFISELNELIRCSSDDKLNILLELIKSICLLGVSQGKNMYCFSD